MMRLATILAVASATAVFLFNNQSSADYSDGGPEPMTSNLLTLANHRSFDDSLGYRVDYRRRYSLEPLHVPGFAGEWTFGSVGYTIQSRDSGDLVTLNVGMRLGVSHRPTSWLEIFTGLGPEGYLFIYYPTTIDEKLNFYTMKSWGLRYEIGSRINLGPIFVGIGHSIHWPIGGEPGPVDFFLHINWPDNILELDRDRIENDTFESNFGEIERVKGHFHHETTFFVGFYF